MSRSYRAHPRAAYAIRLAAPLVVGALAACSDTPTTAPPSAEATAASQLVSPGLTKQERILFSARTDSGTMIFRVSPDGGGLLQITSQGSSYSPSWHPSRQKIVYNRPVFGVQKLMVMSADGSDMTLIGTGYHARYSPDGKKIAFERSVSGAPPQIYIMNADGSGVSQLTNNANGAFLPSWSPDGVKIAFSAAALFGGADDMEVWTTNAKGINTHQVTDCMAQGVRCFAPEWHPVDHDDRIAYSVSPGAVSLSQIRTIEANGLDETVIRSVPKYLPNKFPVWSPDGTRIAFLDKTHPAADWPEIFVMNADGNGVARVTTMDAEKSRLSW
jgi:Tol biopolymer transport system component